MSTALSVALCVLALLATPLCRSYANASPVPPVLGHQDDEEENNEEPFYPPDAPLGPYLGHFGGLSPEEVTKLLLEHQHSEKLTDTQRAFILEWLSNRLQNQQQLSSLHRQAASLSQTLSQIGAKYNLIGSDSDTLDDKEKRGSYMSLCHFKICNMGRKRNLRTPNPWMRQ